MKTIAKAAVLSLGLLASTGCQVGNSEGLGPAGRVSRSQAEKIARQVFEQAKSALVEGRVEEYYQLLSSPIKETSSLEKFRAFYEKNRNSLVAQVRFSNLVHVVPPSREDPFIDMRVLLSDNQRFEWWRLVWDEKDDAWRFQAAGQSVLDLYGS